MKRKSSSVQAQPQKSTTNNEKTAGQKEVVTLDEEKLATLSSSEKDQLLANQIQANNESYGTNNNKQGNDKSLSTQFATINAETKDKTTTLEEDSIGASTSTTTLSARQRQLLQRANALELEELDNDEGEGENGERRIASSSATFDEIEQRLREAAGQSEQSGFFEDGRSLSPLSSIDIGQYTESQQQALLELGRERQSEVPTSGNREPDERRAKQSANTASANDGQLVASSVRVNIPSKTKIGDYARLEYSPMEDLESITTVSQSRAGSTKGSRSYAGSSISRRNSLKTTQQALSVDGDEGSAKSARSSRRSSQGGGMGGGGIESTSISIASQLSNEQLQQNLTNMLEQSASPTTYPLFGTIGLPLGPSLEGTDSGGGDGGGARSETGGKTSPETPGAALTSASQDSLSDASFSEFGSGNSTSKTNKAATPQSSSGGALVQGDSIEDPTELNRSSAITKTTAPIASGEDEPNPKGKLPSFQANNEDDQSRASTVTAIEQQRVGSPQSYATNTSGGLTNPTPTPSEMSQGSQEKKKKLKAKAVLKRFKFGSKKGKSREEPSDGVS